MSAVAKRGSRRIRYWDPEDDEFWRRAGRRIAMRNLAFSILAEHVGFSVWSLWSVLVLFLGPEYGLSPADKFLLVSTPTLVGAALRIPYTLAVGWFGGRTWTVLSAAVLLVPTLLAAIHLRPGTSLGTLLLVSAAAGLGGGNFASSMANINAFFPQRHKGWALGLNAGGGNLGVAVTQLAALAVLGTVGAAEPRLLLGIFVPAIVVATVCAALLMDDLPGNRNDTDALRDVLKDAHCWVMSLLYLGTFGSFIGYCFAFGLVLQTQFDRTPLQAASLTFLGPLLGSLTRPCGGWLADRIGGARVTFAVFVGLMLGAGGAVVASRTGSLGLFVADFVVLLALAGAGNGSTYKMIPAIFRAKALRDGAGDGTDTDVRARLARARRLSGALIGVTGALGALGGVLVNLAFRASFAGRGDGIPAFTGFLVFYAACATVTWAVYLRHRPRPRTTHESRPDVVLSV
ncbi:nitrate/nitrite transporter [Streptomyces sp. AMCC400023]|uniref:nitrate/nitrite transporter n=1 Tax=Streptomyces sp. AMCC400023 TaxID=2056258 RepID=UPI001F2010EB|nr:nitrate/nitrite transporter [Streptomyces sp. AMCC400023]UJV46050.1 MFS transporter [Streptomyces sp. AMCC400023]